MSLSLPSVSLENLEQSFPVRYSIKCDCSENSLEETIEKVASFVSKIYALFPRLDQEKRGLLRNRGMWFGNPLEFPSELECQKFEENLKQKIVVALNEKDCDYSIRFSTDYCPEKILYQICNSAFSQIHDWGLLFPCKTCTEIYLNDDKTRLSLHMDFKGPSF